MLEEEETPWYSEITEKKRTLKDINFIDFDLKRDAEERSLCIDVVLQELELTQNKKSSKCF